MTGRDFSNTIRLSGREWLAVAAFAAALITLAPPLWSRFETFRPGPDYRIPYDLSQDYWLYSRFAGRAQASAEVLLVGDSVVWGQYVRPTETLSHALNARSKAARFANLGLDGAHPAALAGLVEYYGGAVRDRTVLLHFNPLWLSSPRHDLRGAEEFAFNHPRLVPQFFPNIPCYKEGVSARIGTVVDRNVPFLGWAGHLQQAYFERTDIPSWTLEHPYEDPLASVRGGLPPSDDTLRHEPIAWTERGITRQDFPWVDLAGSLQWRSFLRTIDLLRGRGNRVLVLVGPFNESMLTDESLKRYHQLQAEVADGFHARGVEYLMPPALASHLYGDASHPLAAGYEELADTVLPWVDRQTRPDRPDPGR